MFIDRTIKLPKNKNFFLFGPRQTGKSTLLKKEFTPDNTLTVLPWREALEYIYSEA